MDAGAQPEAPGYFVSARADEDPTSHVHLQRTCRQLARSTEIMRLDRRPVDRPICSVCLERQRFENLRVRWRSGYAAVALIVAPVVLAALTVRPVAAQPQVTPSAVTFNYVLGQPLPASQQITVDAGGAAWSTRDSMAWAKSEGIPPNTGGWNNATGSRDYPAGTTAFLIKPKPEMTALAAGTYTATTTVSVGGLQATVQTTLTVFPGAPPAGVTNVQLSYREPSTNDCSAWVPPASDPAMPCPVALDDMAGVRVFYRLGLGAQVMGPSYPASSPVGGQVMDQVLQVPATSGVLEVTVEAYDLSGNVGPRSAPATMTLGAPGMVPSVGVNWRTL